MAVPTFTRLRAVRTVPPHLLWVTAAASATGVGLGMLYRWPLWGVVVVGLLPWAPILTLEIAWTYRHYGWLALFYLLVVTQTGHFIEHVCQMYQLHVLHLHGPHAKGVFGQLDLEWVHFAWNTWVLVAAAAVAFRFRRNPWLVAVVAIAAWHESEHLYIMSVFVRTGAEGTPGLLAAGGALGGGLPIRRPDLHFLYNVVETLPLWVAFVYQLRRTYDSWLARAFPGVPEERLREETPRVRSVRFPTGTTIWGEGELAERSYVLVRGTVEVRAKGAGTGARIASLGPGRLLGAGHLGAPSTAIAVASTPVEVLVLDEQAATALGAGEPEGASVASTELPDALRALRTRLAL